MICYFREGLKPSIKVEMEQEDRESMDFEEIQHFFEGADPRL